MIIGETCLLIASVFVMIGLAKGITSRLYVNDYIAAFVIFLIVFLNIRGGIKLTDRYELFLGGILSVILVIWFLIKRSETVGQFFRAIISSLISAVIVFTYFLHFHAEKAFDENLVVLFASLPLGIWCAVSANRTFASCLFSAIFGSFLGSMFFLLFIQKGGSIGGENSFAVMWLGALTGLIVQYLGTYLLRATNHPRANSYFEAGKMQESSEEKKEDDLNGAK